MKEEKEFGKISKSLRLLPPQGVLSPLPQLPSATLGQAFSSYLQQLAFALERIDAVLPRVRHLAQGGTALGTGINAPEGFG